MLASASVEKPVASTSQRTTEAINTNTDTDTMRRRRRRRTTNMNKRRRRRRTTNTKDPLNKIGY